MKIMPPALKAHLQKKNPKNSSLPTDLYPAPLRSDRECCPFAGGPFSLSLRTSTDSPLNNNDPVSECCIKERGRVEGKQEEKGVQCAGAYLLSVSQVLVFDVAQRLPVGVAAPAATFHLRQRLSFHRVTHLVIPARKEIKKKKNFTCGPKLTEAQWTHCEHSQSIGFPDSAALKTPADDNDPATRVLTGLSLHNV